MGYDESKILLLTSRKMREKLSIIFLVMSFLVLVGDSVLISNFLTSTHLFKNVRSYVRHIKAKSGMEYRYSQQFLDILEEDKLSDNSATYLEQDEDFMPMLGRIPSETFSRERVEGMQIFFDNYRNSSGLTNPIFLADIIKEFMWDLIDTVYVPFDGRSYCYQFGESDWCQVESMDLFVFPIVMNYSTDYNSELSRFQYVQLREMTDISFLGSYGTILNLVIDEEDPTTRIYYCVEYNNEVFLAKKVDNPTD